MNALATGGMETTVLPGDLLVRDHVIQVPVDHAAGPSGRFGSLDIFVRELVPVSKDDDNSLPVLLYLQGGPGFPSRRPAAPPSGWAKAALQKGYRVFLLDQRGTGRSSPVTAQSLGVMASPADQAAFLTHFRADSIVRACHRGLTHVPMERRARLPFASHVPNGVRILFLQATVRPCASKCAKWRS